MVGLREEFEQSSVGLGTDTTVGGVLIAEATTSNRSIREDLVHNTP